jgi:hypothetical protein
MINITTWQMSELMRRGGGGGVTLVIMYDLKIIYVNTVLEKICNFHIGKYIFGMYD